MRVLLVEDDTQLAEALAQVLRDAGMVVDVCGNGRDAEVLGCVESYDAAVLDLGLPEKDGVSVLNHWREQGRQFSVLVLTARGRWSDKLQAFQAGADDYLTKPFLDEEVVMRLRVLQRRQLGMTDSVIQAGTLQYDTLGDRFNISGRALSLTAQEHRILAYLMTRKGQVVSRTEISEHVYARDLDPDSNTVDVLIGRIRRKLGDSNLIHTERGRGFYLDTRTWQARTVHDNTQDDAAMTGAKQQGSTPEIAPTVAQKPVAQKPGAQTPGTDKLSSERQRAR